LWFFDQLNRQCGVQHSARLAVARVVDVDALQSSLGGFLNAMSVAQQFLVNGEPALSIADNVTGRFSADLSPN
jgi:hypothetical protein